MAIYSDYAKGLINMAKLIRDEARAEALRNINEALQNVAVLNAFIDSKNCPFILESTDGKKISTTIDVAYNKRIIAILQLQRTKIIKEIKEKANKFRVMLSDEDMIILGMPKIAVNDDTSGATIEEKSDDNTVVDENPDNFDDGIENNEDAEHISTDKHDSNSFANNNKNTMHNSFFKNW